jgi:predicted Zn-dependent protease
MIHQGTFLPLRTRSAAESAIHNLGSWWRHNVLEHRDDWTGDARFHLGRARRAMDHGDVALAEREASRAVELDSASPWPLVVLGRCALAEHRPSKAVRVLSRAHSLAPANRYVTALLARAEDEARAAWNPPAA